MNHNPQKIPRVSPSEIWYNVLNCETVRSGHNEAYSAGCRENHFWLAAVCDVERMGLCQHPSRVDGKGSYVSDVRAGSGPDVVSLGHALGDHHLAVIAACLRLSPVLGVKNFGLSRPPRWGRFFGSPGPQ